MVESDKEYSLYWIRYDTHTDIHTEGYVGVSCEPNKRFKEHKRNKNNPRVSHAIKKGASMELICSGLTREEVLELEKELRPTDKIGWNLIAGGGMPPSQSGRTFIGTPRTQEQKDHQSKVMTGRPSSLKGKVGHAKGCGTKVCEYRGMEFSSLTEAANHFGVSVSAVSLYRKRRIEGRRTNQTSKRWTY
jgi:predicted GIY-YIG superfamily endonuclease